MKSFGLFRTAINYVSHKLHMPCLILKWCKSLTCLFSLALTSYAGFLYPKRIEVRLKKRNCMKSNYYLWVIISSTVLSSVVHIIMSDVRKKERLWKERFRKTSTRLLTSLFWTTPCLADYISVIACTFLSNFETCTLTLVLNSCSAR